MMRFPFHRLRAVALSFRESALLQLDRVGFFLSQLDLLLAQPELRTKDGLRFLELAYLLTQWLRETVGTSPDVVRQICKQFYNVLRSCDEITYNEDGAAQAYVLLHFLDRYHRFQMIFSELSKLGLMPKSEKPVVLDIGTGPGPSMFAVSDFYNRRVWRVSREPWDSESHVSIDYAERSYGFRNWLHHFTELANWRSPSRVTWAVPYHHGSTYDFSELTFDRTYTRYDYDEEGESTLSRLVDKVRPDLIIMSNFLTTGEQAERLRGNIQNCARHLRHGGLLVVVGARGISSKYREVYESIDRAVLGCDYSRRDYRAWCELVDLPRPTFKYSYNDAWGQVLKRFFRIVAETIEVTLGEAAPKDVLSKLEEWSSPDYAYSPHWEVRVYRKRAFPRDRMKRARAS